MAHNADIRYIRFYTDGSAAKKIAPAVPDVSTITTAPRTHKKKRIRIYVDPVAVLGIAVSVIMLICIYAGISGFNRAQARCSDMQQKVADLRVENARLQEDYEKGYDLSAIGAEARNLGMIPQSSVEHISISVITESEAQTNQAVSQLVALLADLFA